MTRDAFVAQIEAALERSQSVNDAIAAMQSTRPVYIAVQAYARLAVAPQGHPTDPQPFGAVAAQEWIAANGTALTVRAWESLSTLTSAFFDNMAAAQQPDGAWLSTTASDSIELRGYDELVLLHAITSFAVRTGRRDLRLAIEANARSFTCANFNPITPRPSRGQCTPCRCDPQRNRWPSSCCMRP